MHMIGHADLPESAVQVVTSRHSAATSGPLQHNNSHRYYLRPNFPVKLNEYNVRCKSCRGCVCEEKIKLFRLSNLCAVDVQQVKLTTTLKSCSSELFTSKLPDGALSLI